MPFVFPPAGRCRVSGRRAAAASRVGVHRPSRMGGGGGCRVPSRVAPPGARSAPCRVIAVIRAWAVGRGARGRGCAVCLLPCPWVSAALGPPVQCIERGNTTHLTVVDYYWTRRDDRCVRAERGTHTGWRGHRDTGTRLRRRANEKCQVRLRVGRAARTRMQPGTNSRHPTATSHSDAATRHTEQPSTTTSSHRV